MPPLARREEDRLLLANYFLDGLNRKYGERKVLGKAAADLIRSYHWPGNVRQLKNALEAAYVYPSERIDADNFHIFEVPDVPSAEISIPDGGVDLNNDILPRYYRAALEKSGGNAAEAARLLGLKSHTFRARLKAHKSQIY
jgi:DNA-binding NtrC family response regulator